MKLYVPGPVEDIPNHDQQIERAMICGQAYGIMDYDWYMREALRILVSIVCTDDGDVVDPAVTYDFVLRFRHAIRENYNHGHHLPCRHIDTLEGVKRFYRMIEQREEQAMNEACRR